MTDVPRIVNTHDQLTAAVAAGLLPKEHALAISPSTMTGTRYIHGVIVWSPFFKTDPAAAWYHHKSKWFHGSGRAREEQAQARELAIAWVAETYGYRGEWVGNAMRTKVPEIVQKKFPIRRAPKTKTEPEEVEEKNDRRPLSVQHAWEKDGTR